MSTWIKMSERRPTRCDLPVVIGAYVGNSWQECVISQHGDVHPSWTHWFRPELKGPTPPPKEPTQAEKDAVAYNEWRGSITHPSIYDAWLAGIRHARKEATT